MSLLNQRNGGLNRTSIAQHLTEYGRRTEAPSFGLKGVVQQHT